MRYLGIGKHAGRLAAVLFVVLAVACKQKMDFGPEITPGPSIPGEVTLKDLTDEEEFGIKVLSLDENGDMDVTSTDAEAIKVGDYLCSGSTEIAPYGYLVRVTDVQIVETKGFFDDMYDYLISLKTTIANINEVIKNIDFEKRWEVPFDDIEIDEVTDPEGNSISFTKEGKKWTIVDHDFDIGPFTVTPKVYVEPKNLAFFFAITDGEFDKVGMEADWDINASTKIKVSTKQSCSKTISLYHIFLQPIDIQIGPVPVVFTPLFQVYLKVDASGSAQLSMMAFNNTYQMHYGGYCDFQDNTRLKCTPGHEKVFECKVIDELNNDYVNDSQASSASAGIVSTASVAPAFALDSFSLHGDVSASLGVSWSAGLYGCNYIKRVDYFSKKLDFLADMLSVDIWAEVKATIGANYGLNNVWTNLAMPNDDCTFKVDFGVYAQFFARVWSPLRQKFIGFEPQFKIFSFPIVKEKDLVTLFYSDYTNLDITPYSSSAKLSVTKHRPLFGYTLFPEEEYGFCIHKENSPLFSDDYINVRQKPDGPRQALNHFDLNADLSYNRLERKTTYYLYPYSRVVHLGYPYYVYRPGKRFVFSEDGVLSFKNLDNVPGEDL